MKKLFILTCIALSTASFAQNKDEVKETISTKTSVTDSKGTQVMTKNVTQTKKDVVKLSDAQSGQTNQTATRKLSKAKINVSYSNNGSDYMFQEEKSGYKMTSANTKNSVNPYAVLRASSREGYYIMYQNNKSSFGYFDQYGNFVVENYDPATDSVVATKYLIQETGGIKPMRTESENLNETDLKNQRMKEDQKMKNRKNRKLKGGKK